MRRRLVRVEAIINSMTPKERANFTDHQWKSEIEDCPRERDERSRGEPTSETLCPGSEDDETVYQNGEKGIRKRESAVFFVMVTFTGMRGVMEQWNNGQFKVCS